MEDTGPSGRAVVAATGVPAGTSSLMDSDMTLAVGESFTKGKAVFAYEEPTPFCVTPIQFHISLLHPADEGVTVETHLH